jgi:protein-L-isoaspartate(D-aspartate) O-methyltransferase
MRRGVVDELVLAAMRKVPRHHFMPPLLKTDAYADYPSPIGFGQTISQPYIVALMTELLRLRGGERVLEIGTGSGYQAAVLAQIAARVISIERVSELGSQAALALQQAGITNVDVLIQDGSGGYPPEAPYGGILVTACAPAVPDPLLDQLGNDARLVLPVETDFGQVLQVWEKDEFGHLSSRNDIPVAFVPLHGRWGVEGK